MLSTSHILRAGDMADFKRLLTSWKLVEKWFPGWMPGTVTYRTMINGEYQRLCVNQYRFTGDPVFILTSRYMCPNYYYRSP